MSDIQAKSHVEHMNELMLTIRKNGENKTRHNSSSPYQEHMMKYLVTFGLDIFLEDHEYVTKIFFDVKK